ncbi:MAG: fimbria major subunit [Muribaculaceae bacterium]|nr:fimbria major subunit [Muribaculaceae bacterium]
MTTKTTTYSIQGRAGFRSKISVGACSACVVARRFLLFLIFALLTPLSAFFSACGHDDLVVPDEYPEEPPTPYIELRIAVPVANPSSTRANPMGGEEGNGRERGILNEDKIHNINVFFYDDSSYGAKGLDSNSDTPIILHLYYNFDVPDDPANSVLTYTKEDENDNNFESQYIKLRFVYNKEDISKPEGVKFLAVANVGSLKDNNIKDLGTLRDLDLTSSFSSWISDDVFSKNAKNMDHFLMSTAYNTNNTFAGQLTGTNTLALVDGEYSGSTTLQRMYARLDLWYNAEVNAGSVTDPEDDIEELVYPVNGADGNNVYLTNVLAVNVKKTASYVFKKVTADHTGIWDKNDLSSISSFNWGGKESPNDGPYTGSSNDDKPQNYVMEPYTLYKNEAGTVGNFKKANGIDGSLKDWYGNTTVDDIKEAIKSSANGKFSEYYHMTRSKGIYDKDYNCNHISIISYANENTHPTDCFHPNYLTGMAFRAVYVPDKIYSGTHETTNDEGETVTVPTEWTSGTPTKIYRYSPSGRDQKESKSLYFTDRDQAVTYSKAHPEDNATISKEAAAFTAVEHVVGKDEEGKEIKKWGFICYYNLWLRHYNDEGADPQTSYPMEYATVRNNIYRVSVSFSGPGDPTPTMREPDTMKARIFVRKWNYKEEPTITF